LTVLHLQPPAQKKKKNPRVQVEKYAQVEEKRNKGKQVADAIMPMHDP
jgi:hypothetical protein